MSGSPGEGREEWGSRGGLIAFLFIIILVSNHAAAGELTCHPVKSSVHADGSASEWSSIDASSLPGGEVSVKAAWTPENLYLLLQIQSPTRAYLVTLQGLEIWVEAEGFERQRYIVRYAGSKALAKEIETLHNPFSKSLAGAPDLPPQGPPLEPPPDRQPPQSGERPKPDRPPFASPMPQHSSDVQQLRSVFKKTMDPGILFVTHGKEESIQLECSGDGPCAASLYEEPLFNYEFVIPWDAEVARADFFGGKGTSKIKLGLKIPDLKQDQEIHEQRIPEGAMKGGAGGMGGGEGGMGGGPGGMGGGPPGGTGGGMGGGPPGGGMGGGPGGPPSGVPGGRPGPGPTYSVSKTTQWLDLVFSTDPPVRPPSNAEAARQPQPDHAPPSQ